MGSWQLLLLIFFVLFILLLPVLALISILRNEFKGNDKLIWVLVVLLLPFLGSILYFTIARPKTKHSRNWIENQ
ncbi:MAG: PLDc N-terminal domain-containing protein [Bacteroidota bacterium]